MQTKVIAAKLNQVKIKLKKLSGSIFKIKDKSEQQAIKEQNILMHKWLNAIKKEHLYSHNVTRKERKQAIKELEKINKTLNGLIPK